MSLFSSTRRRLGWVAVGICIAALSGISELRRADAAATATPTSFVAIEPIRVLDTRVTDTRVTDRTGLIEMRLTEQIALPNGRIIELVPAAATAVSLNVTAVDGIDRNGFGFVTVHPCDVATPNTSNINFRTGQTVPNAVIAPLSPDGRVCFAVYGSAHLLADLNGYFIPLSDSPQGESPSSRYSDSDIDSLLDDKADANLLATLSERVDEISLDAITAERVEAIESDLGEVSESFDSLVSESAEHASTLANLSSDLATVESTLVEHAAQLERDQNTSASPHRISAPSSATMSGVVSNGSDIARRLSGLPVIVSATAGGNLVVIDCDDRLCTTSTSTTISDPGGDTIGNSPAVTIGIDGNPVIAHRNLTDADLMVTACDDDACQSSTTTSIATPDVDGITPDIIIGRNGFPVIAHQSHDENNLPLVGHLRVLTCNDRACAGTETLSPIHSSAAVGNASSEIAAGFMPSISLGLDGFPVLAHQVRTHAGASVTASEVQLISCNDSACVGADERVVVLRSSAGGDVGWNPKVAMTPAGTPLVAHLDGASLLMTECRDASCFTRDITTVTANGVPRIGTLDVQLGHAGQPIVTYTTTTDDLGIGLCHPSGCSTSAVTTVIDTDNIDGISPRFTIDDIGRPIVVSSDLFGDLHIEIPWWVTQ